MNRELGSGRTGAVVVTNHMMEAFVIPALPFLGAREFEKGDCLLPSLEAETENIKNMNDFKLLGSGGQLLGCYSVVSYSVSAQP